MGTAAGSHPHVPNSLPAAPSLGDGSDHHLLHAEQSLALAVRVRQLHGREDTRLRLRGQAHDLAAPRVQPRNLAQIVARNRNLRLPIRCPAVVPETKRPTLRNVPPTSTKRKESIIE